MKKNAMCPTIVLAAVLVLGLATGLSAQDRPEQSLLTIKTYIFSGSFGEDQLSFPLFPYMSMAVLEETITDAESFSDKLRSLYAFSEYALLDRSTVYVRLTGYPRATASRIKTDPAEKTGPWQVAINDFAWDMEGRLQMMVTISRKGESFIESHVSVKPGRSVVLGRFADEQMGQAVFAVVAPVVEVEVAPKLGAMEKTDAVSRATIAPVTKKGLPPPGPKKWETSVPCPTDTKPGIDDFVPVSKMPEILTQRTPEYPAAAVQAGAEGKVWLRSLISQEGKVLECCVARPSGRDDLDQAAITASRNNTYIPAQDEAGNPVAVWVSFQVVFSLKSRN